MPITIQNSHTVTESRYCIVIPEETVCRAGDYLKQLQFGQIQAGALLNAQLKDVDFAEITSLDLLGRLFDTKSPQIFAESAVAGDGSDWNQAELGLLGDVSIAVPVTVFDNGSHTAPMPHVPPFSGTLVYTPGALLRNGCGQVPVDWRETTTPDGQLCREGYYNLYRRRLLPVLRYINDHTGKPRSAFVTVPGVGCGEFSGPFQGKLGAQLSAVIEQLLVEYGDSFPNLKAVYFDPYNECKNQRREINGISFMVRPLRASGNHQKPQLCRPVTYAEAGDDFSECALYSIVAWDHVSWPGNDFYMGSRATDDGVKAAASSSMFAIMGVEGMYDTDEGKYQPPQPYHNWDDVVEDKIRTGNLRLWNLMAVRTVSTSK